MEVIAALGLGAKELFSYNRENFKFDQDQRLERETLRLEMQVKRFELFREDIRDLVELTVDRMDVYHLVGALFLEFCIVLFCEGRVQASAPPFLLSLFLLSNACAFIYLLLAVWLSMHASIASHSFGVRLLTRFVRLPIPSVKQINSLRSQLRDYERQGVANLLRMPFQHTVAGSGQDWYADEKDEQEKKLEALRNGMKEAKKGFQAETMPHSKEPDSPQTPTRQLRRTATEPGLPAKVSSDYLSSRVGGDGEKTDKLREAGAGLGVAEPSSPVPMTIGKKVHFPESPGVDSSSSKPRKAKSASSGSDPMVLQPPAQAPRSDTLLPEEAESPFGGEDLLAGGRGALPERHVQLFRQLQSKWQCYDAYCRVCMGLGVNQILQGLSYYAVCHTLVENHSPTTGYAMVVLFQCTTVALAVLDLAGLRRREIIAVQVVGMMPCVFTAISIANAERDGEGALDANEHYPFSPLSFFFQVLWLELWLRVAQPTDTARLPRRFRQVLFLDVFGDAYSGWTPPGLNMEGPSLEDIMATQPEEVETEPMDADVAVALQQATSQLALAQWAVRRWVAVPDHALSQKQRKELDMLKELLHSWGHSIKGEVDRCAHVAGQQGVKGIFEEKLRRWEELQPEERSADPFAGCLLGPFEHDGGYTTSTFHFSLETQQSLLEDEPSKVCPGALVLTLQAVTAVVADLEKEARRLLEVRIMYDRRLTDARRERERIVKEKGLKKPPPILHEEDEVSRLRCGPSSFTKPASAAKANFPNLVSMLKDRKKHRFRQAPSDEVEGANLLSSSQTAPSLGVAASLEPPEPQRKSKRDPTLVAMAGQHAMHFVPERLPWQVLSHMTRVLQVCWFFACLMAFLKETGLLQVDYQQHPGHERRLHARVAEPWVFEPVDMQWPHGSFFHPEGVSCLAGSLSKLVVTSPFAVYFAAAEPSMDGWAIQELLRYKVPPSAFPVCLPARQRASSDLPRSSAAPAPLGRDCLLLAPSEDGVMAWPVDDRPGGASTVSLPLVGPAWRLLAGTIIPCELVASLLPLTEVAEEQCLLLAGWDGDMLPIAVAPLVVNSTSSSTATWRLPVREGLELLPSLDVPLPLAEARRGMLALHMEASGRLWALLDGGVLLAWDVVGLRALGRWRVEWKSHQGTFQPTGLCGDASEGFVIVGRSDSVGPLLMQSGVPACMEEVMSKGSTDPSGSISANEPEATSS